MGNIIIGVRKILADDTKGLLDSINQVYKTDEFNN